jgi:predicted transposase YdaD
VFCKHLYGSQVRASRTIEGCAWTELDREAGRQAGGQAGRQAGRQAGMRPNICRLHRRSKTLQQVFMQRSCTRRGNCRTKIALVAMLEED